MEARVGIPEAVLQADEAYMQALANNSYIDPGHAGDVPRIDGTVVFQADVDPDAVVPHLGWEVMHTPEDRERVKHSDPAGVDSPFHFEAGKPRVDQLPPAALLEIAAVMGYGASKYGEWNWAEYADKWKWGQLIGSALRHIYAWMRREDIDPESGLNHMAHAGANIMMLLDLMAHGNGKDNRRPSYKED